VGGDDRRSRAGDYHLARSAAAVAITAAIVLMSVADIFSTEYEAPPAVLIILGTLVLALLGLEARDLLRPGGDDR
jgi:hypothetical protein